MKNMKKVKLMMMTLIMCLVSTLTFTQSDIITYEQLQNSEKRIKGTFTYYTTKEGVTYKVGDTLKLGTPSTNKTFTYIQMVDVMGTMYPVSAAVSNYFISLENAILYGEVNTGVMTSDEALSELKKSKDKFDLGLISEEEYNEKKKELSKLIK